MSRRESSPPIEWPVVTAYCSLPLGTNGATPVTLGVGREGRRVGYYSGGHSSPTTLGDRPEVELWLRLDPDALADIPAVRVAVARYHAAQDADRVLGLEQYTASSCPTGATGSPPCAVDPCSTR